MRQPYQLSVAFRYLRARRRESFISFISLVSMIGIALAVAVLIVVASVMDGFEYELQRRILSVASHASINSFTALEDWRALRERALARPDVLGAAPFVEGQGMIVAGEKTAGVTVRGIDPALEASVSGIGGMMRTGTLGALTPDGYRIVIGASLAESLGVGVGDEIVIALARDPIVTPVGIVPRQRSFTVSGVFDAGMYEYDHGLALVNIAVAARLFNTGGDPTGLRLAVRDIYSAQAIAIELAETLDQRVYVTDWTRQHVNFFNSIRLSKSIMFVILSMVVAVAAFNIVSTLVMVVRDKRGDIAILRSFGAAPRSIMSVFASQGTMIGVAGTLLGVLLALLVITQLHSVVELLEAWLGIDLLSEEVYFLGELPTRIRAGEVAKICLIALLLAVAATIYPALSAARQPPAEALRYE
ncbi:MAG TPA: lipoprotein-releasing ABC transporter permease subunit [Gammaproteobacteria bacterium]